ncbi:MAG: ABC-2 transporter permease [Eubacteriales bacterium]|nr:ABC-2 transporter permease [Eubacteriales bacterium]
MITIYKRELKSFFITSTGYVFLFSFTVLTGLLFYFGNILTRYSDLSSLYAMTAYIWILLIPMLTMRLITEEKKNGTNLLLASAPISDEQIVGAKYLAALSLLIIALMFGSIYPLTVAVFGPLYLPEALTGLLGVLLYGAALIAVDMFVSSFAKNAASAFALSLIANLFLRFAGLFANSIKFAPLSYIVSLLDTEMRFNPFLYGQLSFASVLYFILFIFVNMVFTYMAVKNGSRD